MKRDMELVRKLLLWIEAQEHGRNIAWKIEIDGYTEEQIGYHAYIMAQAGLITAMNATYSDSKSHCYVPESLTWDGHEFLSAIKDDTVWAKARETVLKPAVGATLAVILEWAKAESLRRLGLS